MEQYTPAAVAGRGFAFDGTVVEIGPGTSNKPGRGQLDTVAVTFKVNEWWRGGSGSTVTIDMGPPAAPSAHAETGAAYGVGTRLLVSGEARWGGKPLDDPIAWGCGFTRYHDTQTAEAWRNAAR